MVVIQIEASDDAFLARRKGRQLARKTGFEETEARLIEIAISELATNIIKHATEGDIRIEQIKGGIKFVSMDHGPGIDEPDKLLKNIRKRGLSSSGLSSVQRIGDEIEISSEVDGGTKITVKKWKDPSNTKQPQKSRMDIQDFMQYGVVSLPAYKGDPNGDQYFIKEYDGNILISLIDGLGHGKQAWTPANKAIHYLSHHFTERPTHLLKGCHRTLRGTRGAVMSISKIDLGQSTLTYSGIGNIRMKILRKNNEIVRPVSLPGIVGRRCRKVKEWKRPYTAGDTLYVFSDGISSRFDPEKLRKRNQTPEELAEHIMRTFGKSSDDSTIIVAREEDGEILQEV